MHRSPLSKPPHCALEGTVREVAAMLKAIHTRESRERVLEKAVYVEGRLGEMQLTVRPE